MAKEQRERGWEAGYGAGETLHQRGGGLGTFVGARAAGGGEGSWLCKKKPGWPAAGSEEKVELLLSKLHCQDISMLLQLSKKRDPGIL